MHGLKIIHRDLKPDNIFLKDGIVKIGDFGVAKVLIYTKDVAGTSVGTVTHMSPEVIEEK